MYGLHFGCWVLARALCERRLLELGLVLPEDGRYREPTARKSKTPSVFGWREVMREAGSRFSARPKVSR